MAILKFGGDNFSDNWGLRKERGSQRALSQNNRIVKPERNSSIIKNNLIICNSSISNSISIVVNKTGIISPLQDNPDQHCILR